jgi:hypothetical protein
MEKRAYELSSGQPYSTSMLWIGLFSALLLFAIVVEAVCVGIIYVSNSLRGIDNSMFAQEHFLTNIFVSTPPSPVPGKRFLGHLRFDQPAVWNRFLVPDDLLGWRLAPAISAVFPAPPHSYLFITDDNGFIADVDDPPVTLRKPEDAYRVIVLGGSTVMGDGAPRPSQNIVGMLRKGVRERGLTGPGGKRVELINAGVDGYNSAQEYLYLVSDLLRFKPDLVIVYDGWNDSKYDFNNNFSPFRNEAHRENTRRIARSYSTLGSAQLFAENLAHVLSEGNFKLGMFELLRRAYRKLSSDADKVDPTLMPSDWRTIEYYGQNRRAFLALADDQMSIALFLQPLVGNDDRMLSAEEKALWGFPRLAELMGNSVPFYEHARHILADLEARDKRNSRYCIADLSHSLKSASEPVYADPGHLLPKGNEIVAGHILDRLLLCGFLR